jgi:hypothetical protein
MKDFVSIDFSPVQCLLEFCMSDMLLPKISFEICPCFSLPDIDTTETPFLMKFHVTMLGTCP